MSIPEAPEATSRISSDSQFKVYDDEVAPVPLEDYTPMEVDEELTEPEPVVEPEPQTMVSAPSLEPKREPASEYGSLPSLDELKPPDFDSETASEYDTEFILEEETESLEAVLKELGWEEE
ncbi:MAG: hypothetical protein EU550_03425 [Promethearchaeota archaeon]|nr:MAG: hypothetical protein EU550_03425 [Candidatus Lokiarchaeota archaeon]